MAFVIADLLLTEDRLAQLTAGLANLGVTDPLARCITEADAEVTRYTSGYVIDTNSRNAWIRILALHKAFTLAETGVPGDIEAQCKDALEELRAIAEGRRPNLERTPAVRPVAGGGRWGSGLRKVNVSRCPAPVVVRGKAFSRAFSGAFA